MLYLLILETVLPLGVGMLQLRVRDSSSRLFIHVASWVPNQSAHAASCFPSRIFSKQAEMCLITGSPVHMVKGHQSMK